MEAGPCQWRKNKDYFRLDGSVVSEDRKRMCKMFNNSPDARLMLVSTRAGGQGINLFAANRVIVFDASWNPTQDTQSMFRVYRFGQKKSVYIYRFISGGTIEHRIYHRQVLKSSLADLVVDKSAKERHFTNDDVSEYYRFNPYMEPPSSIPAVPTDSVLADIVYNQGDKWIANYYEHDTLLQDDAFDLSEEEKRTAWEEYERDRERMKSPPPEILPGVNVAFQLPPNPLLPQTVPLSFAPMSGLIMPNNMMPVPQPNSALDLSVSSLSIAAEVNANYYRNHVPTSNFLVPNLGVVPPNANPLDFSNK